MPASPCLPACLPACPTPRLPPCLTLPALPCRTFDDVDVLGGARVQVRRQARALVVQHPVRHGGPGLAVDVGVPGARQACGAGQGREGSARQQLLLLVVLRGVLFPTCAPLFLFCMLLVFCLNFL
jgi:hypothetical protein